MIGGYGTVNSVSYFKAVLKNYGIKGREQWGWKCECEHHSTIAFATGLNG